MRLFVAPKELLKAKNSAYNTFLKDPLRWSHGKRRQEANPKDSTEYINENWVSNTLPTEPARQGIGGIIPYLRVAPLILLQLCEMIGSRSLCTFPFSSPYSPSSLRSPASLHSFFWRSHNEALISRNCRFSQSSSCLYLSLQPSLVKRSINVSSIARCSKDSDVASVAPLLRPFIALTSGWRRWVGKKS